MATMTRSELIAEGRLRAGRRGQAILLTVAFDDLLKKITRDYPTLPHVCYVFSTVANQSYVALPYDYRSWEQCFYGDVELEWMDPEEYFYNLRTGTDTAAIPSYYVIVKDENKIYFWNKPSANTTSYFYYAGYHPKANKTLSFTSGGTYQVKTGDTVTGETSSATMAVDFVRVTSGSWAGGDAVGKLVGTVSGTFVSETLKVGTTLNVATVATDAVSADSFQHFLGEEFDEVLVEGLTWKCLDLISDKNAVDRAIAKDKKKDFEQALLDVATMKGLTELKTPYREL